VGLNSLKSLNLTNVYPNKNKNKNNNNNNKKNNKVKSKPLELRSRTFFSRGLMNERIFSLVIFLVVTLYIHFAYHSLLEADT
jgi:hypothetical protein